MRGRIVAREHFVVRLADDFAVLDHHLAKRAAVMRLGSFTISAMRFGEISMAFAKSALR